MKDNSIKKKLLAAQRNEISEYHTYTWLAKRTADIKNKEILERIAGEELVHYNLIKKITGVELNPRRFWVLLYRVISRVFGLSFGLRLMEMGEKNAEKFYSELEKEMPELAKLSADEEKHESYVLSLIREERIEYAGSMVLGLNDALVELTGALAGLTLALQNSKIIAMTGLITGVAASMSMSASGYLSAREEADINTNKNPLKSATYTGIAYIITVAILIIPYLVLSSVFLSAAVMLTSSILIILCYNFYITTAKGIKLWRRFIEMALISLGVACISFLIGILARIIFEVEI
jgi:VIT1/CCC1 family predicted Fe2+/Mn2+ transporter